MLRDLPGITTHAVRPIFVAMLLSTGCEGLDDILGGGLTKNRLYLLHGEPGTGKTTLGLQVLLEGLEQGERGLYISLSESQDELEASAETHGWKLTGMEIRDFAALGAVGDQESENTLFHHSEVELGETIRNVFEAVKTVKPARVVLDSLSELRLLAGDSLRHRRQVLALKQFFAGRRCTVVLLDDRHAPGDDTQSIAHGVIQLEQLSPGYGGGRRRVRIPKLRGARFRSGYHDYRIETGGLMVFPRLIAAEHHVTYPYECMSSGVPELDEMLGGGLDRGTSALIMGPAGAGKSALATQYVAAAAARGETSALLVFDEGLATVYSRALALGHDLRALVAARTVIAQQIDPAELPPGELMQRVRTAVEKDGARVVVIDSLNGYLNSMPEENFLLIQLHELLSYLRQRGVLAILVVAQHGIVGTNMGTPVDVSYLADTVVLLRFFEAAGELRKAVSIVKKRSGRHETSIRELSMSAAGLRVGQPLREFHGILTGVPRLEIPAAEEVRRSAAARA